MKGVTIRKRYLGQLVAIVWLLTGCAVGPNYVKVSPEAPKKWHAQLQNRLCAAHLDPKTMARWWTTLNDPELTRLEELAVKGNLDLKEARARVREARAQRSIEVAGLFPTLDASGSATKQRSSKNSGILIKDRLYRIGFDASWELDVFGGTRRAIEAAQADLEGQQEALHEVLVSLMAEVALNYTDVRTYQARLAAAHANIKAQKEIYDLNRSRYRAGLIDELAVQQSLYNLERTRSQVPTLETGLERAKNRLAILLGKRPGDLEALLAVPGPIPVPPLKVAVGIPVEALRQRPDVRKAERNLAAATARIGVAKAELYPKFQLLGTIGLESLSSGDIWEWASRTWKVGPGISWKIFHWGALRQNIKVQTARQEQALIQYRSTVLKALEEVEDSLVAFAKEQRRMKSLKTATDAAKIALGLAWDRYKAGLVDFSNVMDAEQSLQSFQDELAVSRGAVTSNFIRLDKALGGGWNRLKAQS